MTLAIPHPPSISIGLCLDPHTVMAQGRGSATVALGTSLLLLLVNSQISESAIYTVGDKGGWTFNMDGWPRGKRFRAGDELVFRYNPGFHNVVEVSGTGHSRCTTPRGSRVFQSGNDRIRLARGTNYFICSFTGNCEAGMKIAVTAV